ncbi:hypothetical protein BATDEDRAFT_22905 [Batrachochytrium dendrobatidis JAM81]|uniref:UBC core domain-containing protein n=2 Tax=Batrachochytrium dendrobatidis TaxID=109871 RepID=F4NW55_BATDJ|nr:uncharacterized protein BATDEDRAFT_22905 [Batrachochytrium dendrobatidis JAM81]EGF82420.1 hypothetical protein BATDEDRAFT_22905 [Batrachochytrium dendrobatidis JAM81]OAJ39688.1 hypothetical protein BDEG_23518 [Batrachochytrium dendrobatidis JEL423]|eukprot:XP_006676662.1 hypothetical protein BATDEDRAFT_22905 [Batrachochytrium dendrobatidis JAM81]
MSSNRIHSDAPLQNQTESSTSNLFRRYQLLIEYKNLRSSNSCPTGVYVIPDIDNLYLWHGTIFLHRGHYKEGVFKFYIEIPDSYPEQIPIVRFITDMFHPLIDRDGYFNLGQQFIRWRPYKDFICHILHYIKNSFRESTMCSLEGKFKNEKQYFSKLAAQCAQLSSSEPILFDKDSNHLMTFTPIDDSQFAHIQSLLYESVGHKAQPVTET